MIKNERQYRITRNQARRFSQTLAKFESGSAKLADGTHPLIAKAHEDAIRSQLNDLEAELQEYEGLRSGAYDARDLNVVYELPTALIKARIARGLSQKDLAQRLKLKEQQIQRYEATDYASASLSRIRDVVTVLDSVGH